MRTAERESVPPEQEMEDGAPSIGMEKGMGGANWATLLPVSRRVVL
jgi:hypothetical protein